MDYNGAKLNTKDSLSASFNHPVVHALDHVLSTVRNCVYLLYPQPADASRFRKSRKEKSNKEF
jgi:hypothetical protein